MLFINFFSTYLSFENKGGTQALSFILIVLMSLKKKVVMMATLNITNNYTISWAQNSERKTSENSVVFRHH